MDPVDRAEVREMLLDIISGPLEKINGQYRLVSAQLSNIDIQTTKTNSTVARHDIIINENLPHTTANCPQQDKILEIRDSMISGKAIRKTIIFSITATGTLFTIFFIIYQIFIK
jgi:hypothetical protein